MSKSADPDQLVTDLDLHCLQRRDISRFSRTRVKLVNYFQCIEYVHCSFMMSSSLCLCVVIQNSQRIVITLKMHSK